jgi:hypothetical protein
MLSPEAQHCQQAMYYNPAAVSQAELTLSTMLQCSRTFFLLSPEAQHCW